MSLFQRGRRGRQIAFHSNRGGNVEIYVTGGGGSNGIPHVLGLLDSLRRL